MVDTRKPLHVDIPVELKEVKIAFNIAGLSFEGDLPASIFHLQLITQDIADWNARSQVIAVFNTNAGHPILTDAAYNAERMIKTGNPYKELIIDLMRRGVKMEICGATAAAHKWTRRGLHSRGLGQHRRHGADGAAGAGRVRGDHRVGLRIFSDPYSWELIFLMPWGTPRSYG